MDFRFLTAGILAAALGFISGSTVFASAPQRAVDPALAQAADDRAAVIAAAAQPLPPVAVLPALPRMPAAPKLPDVNAVAKVRRVRIVVVRSTAPATSRGTVRHEAERGDDRGGSDHERGDD